VAWRGVQPHLLFWIFTTWRKSFDGVTVISWPWSLSHAIDSIIATIRRESSSAGSVVAEPGIAANELGSSQIHALAQFPHFSQDTDF
jgi:hypothetical protein